MSNFAPPTRMKKRETALHFAAKEGTKDTIDSLVNAKAEIDARDTVRTGITCVSWRLSVIAAAICLFLRGSVKIAIGIIVLSLWWHYVKMSTNTNICCTCVQDFKTPLIVAAGHGNSNAMKALIELGASIAVMDHVSKYSGYYARDVRNVNLLRPTTWVGIVWMLWSRTVRWW